jgi:hypothetical protein
LGELRLNGGDQIVALSVHVVLSLEQRATFFVTAGFEAADTLLGDEFVLQSEGSGGLL